MSIPALQRTAALGVWSRGWSPWRAAAA